MKATRLFNNSNPKMGKLRMIINRKQIQKKIFSFIFFDNSNISPFYSNLKGVIMLFLVLALLYSAGCYNVTLKESRELVIEYFEAGSLISYKTESKIYVLQIALPDKTEIINFKEVDHISVLDDKLILWTNEDATVVSVSEYEDTSFLVDGFMVFTNNDSDIMTLSSILEQMLNETELNCWAGGPGAKSCTVRHSTSEIKVTCREGFNPCCTRDITGICSAQ